MNKCYKIYISHVVRSIGLLIVIVVDNKQKILDNKKHLLINLIFIYYHLCIKNSNKKILKNL